MEYQPVAFADRFFYRICRYVLQYLEANTVDAAKVIADEYE